MRLFAFALLLFCLGLGMWFSGITTPLSRLYATLGSGQPTDLGVIITDLVNAMLNPAFILTVVGVAVTVGLLTGFAAVYVIPAMIIVALSNLILVPTSFFIQCNSTTLTSNVAISAANTACSGAAGAVPFEIGVPYFLLVQLLLYATIWEFIRGGG